MKTIFISIMMTFTSIGVVHATFSEKAKEQAQALKKGLLTQVQSKMAEGGPLKAVEFCHLEALPLTKKLSEEGFVVGRTSLKIRNESNRPKDWMKKFLNEANATTMDDPYEARVVKNDEGQDVFLTPLYMQGACLMCHGNPKGQLQEKLSELYPNDQAKGYKAGEFRGFVWVKKKDSTK